MSGQSAAAAATFPDARETGRLRAERDELRRRLAALLRAGDPLAVKWRRMVAKSAYDHGYEFGQRDGWAAGYAQAVADLAAAWRTVTQPVAQGSPSATVRVNAAVAGERRDAAEHERQFYADAVDTPPSMRSDPQNTVIFLAERRREGRP